MKDTPGSWPRGFNSVKVFNSCRFSAIKYPAGSFTERRMSFLAVLYAEGAELEHPENVQQS
jgi:hypothetical protein